MLQARGNQPSRNSGGGLIRPLATIDSGLLLIHGPADDETTVVDSGFFQPGEDVLQTAKRSRSLHLNVIDRLWQLDQWPDAMGTLARASASCPRRMKEAAMGKRTIVITGASDGIGAAAARRLSQGGDSVVVVGRSPQKTAAVANELGADFFVTDFMELAQVRELAAKLLERYPVIDILANNAGGLMGSKRVLTVDGHEKTFQVNHLAPFLLTTLLIDRLIASNARVLNTSSVGNKTLGNLDINDLDAASGYKAMRAYGTSKLENILFTRELHRRYHDQGITTAAFHPGNVASNFSSESDSRVARLIYGTPLKRILLITPEKGAGELVWLATSVPGSDWESGQYYDKHKPGAVNKQAEDPQLAVQLWERSAALVAPNVDV